MRNWANYQDVLWEQGLPLVLFKINLKKADFPI